MPSEAAADRAPLRPGDNREAPRDSVLVALRRAIGKIEKKYADLEGGAAVVPFGISPLGAALGGGHVKGAMLVIVADGEPLGAASAGFALRVAARVAARPFVWIGEDMAAHESGSLYGLGLDELGITPDRMIVVRTPRTADALWAMEE